METLKFSPEFELNKIKAIPKNVSTGKILKSILIIFVLSWISVLSSCVVAVPHQRYQRQTIVVEKNYRGEHHDNGKHKGWYKSNGKKKGHSKGNHHD